MSKIEWTDKSWNPVVGCSKISEGCQNCYAEKMACRLAHIGNRAYQDVTEGDTGNWFRRWRGNVVFREDQINKPLKWKKPRKIFVCSMSDLFHREVAYQWFVDIIKIIIEAKHHIFMILTKRPELMKEYFEILMRSGWGSLVQKEWPLKNLGLGVSVCNNDELHKIETLKKIPAVVRFVSFEPLLSKITDVNLNGIDWVICGGESGPRARPMQPDWVRSLRDQCQGAGVPFFFKQWGEWAPTDKNWGNVGVWSNNKFYYECHPPDYEGIYMGKVGKKKAGRLLDGREWNEYPKEALCQ